MFHSFYMLSLDIQRDFSWTVSTPEGPQNLGFLLLAGHIKPGRESATRLELGRFNYRMTFLRAPFGLGAVVEANTWEVARTVVVSI